MVYNEPPTRRKIMAIPKGFKAQEIKEENTHALKEEYQPLMDAFLKLHFEAHSMIIGKGDENAYFKSLVNFATLVREAAPQQKKAAETIHTNGAAIHSNGK